MLCCVVLCLCCLVCYGGAHSTRGHGAKHIQTYHNATQHNTTQHATQHNTTYQKGTHNTTLLNIKDDHEFKDHVEEYIHDTCMGSKSCEMSLESFNDDTS